MTSISQTLAKSMLEPRLAAIYWFAAPLIAASLSEKVFNLS